MFPADNNNYFCCSVYVCVHVCVYARACGQMKQMKNRFLRRIRTTIAENVTIVFVQIIWTCISGYERNTRARWRVGIDIFPGDSAAKCDKFLAFNTHSRRCAARWSTKRPVGRCEPPSPSLTRVDSFRITQCPSLLSSHPLQTVAGRDDVDAGQTAVNHIGK